MIKTLKTIISIISIVFGVLSLVVLARQGLSAGTTEIFDSILKYYLNFMEILLGWIDPFLQRAIAFANTAFGSDISFNPFWKHIFVIIWLYFGSDFYMNLKSERYLFGVFSLICASIIAIISSVITVSLNFSEPELNPTAVAVPILGIIAFDIIRCVWGASFAAPDRTAVFLRAQLWIDRFLRRLYIYVVPTIILGILILFFGKKYYSNIESPVIANPNLFILLLFICLIAIYWILRGFWVRFTLQEESDMMNVGINMFSVFIATIIFLILNAGLEPLGL